MMRERWFPTTLGAVCEDGGTIQTGPFGSQLHASDYTELGTPVVMPVNIGANFIDSSGIARIGPADADRLMRHRLRPGDIVYSRRGDITKRAIVGGDEDGWICGTGCLLVRPGQAVHRRWLFYWLGAPWCHSYLLSRAVGATMPNLNTGLLSSLPVNLPPLEEQRRIADVLGALDDLSALELGLGDACGELWRSIVMNSMDSRGTSRLPLSELAAFVNGRNFTKDASGLGRPVIRTPEVRGGPSASTIRADWDADDDRIARLGDILFVWSGSLCAARWAYEEGLVNQHVFKVIPASQSPDWLVTFAVERQMKWFQSLAADKATTMGHIQRRHLDEPVALPMASELGELEELVRPLWDQELASRIAARDASSLRDDLLPLLMSGRVRAGEVAP